MIDVVRQNRPACRESTSIVNFEFSLAPKITNINISYQLVVDHWWTGTDAQSSTSGALTRVQCKLGKQYLRNKVTLHWESNPGPTPTRGDIVSIKVSVLGEQNIS